MKLILFLKEKLTPELRYILLLFLVTRITLAFIGTGTFGMLKDWHENEYRWVDSKYRVLDIWGVWDTGHYLEIAKNGYSKEISHSIDTPGQANYAFFPLYPALIKVAGVLIGDFYFAGLLISNIALLVACYFLFKLVSRENGEEDAYRTIKYLFLFPTAFILSGVFTESLFIAILIAAFYYLKKRKWLIAGILGFILALTKMQGVLIIFPFAYEYLITGQYKKNGALLKALYLLFPAFGIALFSIYNKFLTGDYFAFLSIQKTGWGHELTSPIKVLIDGVLSDQYYLFFGACTALAALSAVIVFWRHIGSTLGILSLLLIIFPLFSGNGILNSVPRYLLAAFPLYIILGRVSKNPLVDQSLMIALALIQGFLMVFWCHGFNLVV